MPKRDSPGNSNLTNGVNCSQNMVSKSNGARRSQGSASGIRGVTQPIGIVYVPVGLAGCNGIIRFTVVEQDVPTSIAGENDDDTSS